MTFSFGTPQPSAASAAPAFSLTTPGLTTTPMGGFGAPAASTTSFGFGATPATQSSGFSFGAATSSAPTAAATPFSLGTQASTAASTGGFGGFGAAPTAAPAFGAPATTSAAPPAFGGFGSTATATVAPTLGGFGAPATTSAAPAFNLGGFGATTSSAAAAPAFNFSTPSTAAKPLTLGGGFGTTPASTATPFGAAPTASAPGQAFSGFGATSTATTQFSGFSLGGQAQTTAATGIVPPSTQAAKPTVGLGGTSFSGFGGTTVGSTSGSIPVTSSGQAQAGADANKATAAGGLKESNVPKELMDDIDNFKKFVKEEKSVSSDIAHVSPKMHQKLKTEIKALNTIVKELSSGVAKQKLQVEKLKTESALEMQNVEIAQRTKDTPPALQYENIAPYTYFNRLIADFETQMIRYARQIEETEQHLMTSGAGGNGSMTPDDLVKAMQKIHSAFISLAGKYEPIHDAVKQQKAIYLQKYRQKHGTVEDPFELNRKNKKNEKESGITKPRSTLGPSPFTGKPDPMALARATLNAGQAQGPRPTGLTGPPTLGLSTANNAFGMPAAGAAPAANPFGGGTGGFSFGTPSNTTGAAANPFGAPASSSSIFGTPAGAAKPNLTLGFGQTNTFGAQTQASTLPAFGTTNTFGTPQTQASLMGGGFGATSSSAFGATQPTTNFSFGTSSAGTGTPGLFGSTMSPFGQQQTLGKRGKH